MACGLRAVHATRADSCRTRGRVRAASVPVAPQPPSQPACAGRIPRRLRLASRPGAGRVDCGGPVRCSHRAWLARIPDAWTVSSRTGSRRAGARSTRAPGTRRRIGEKPSPGSQGVSGRAHGIEVPGRGWLAEGRAQVACSFFQSPPSCASELRGPRCPPSSFLHRPRKGAADNRLHERSVVNELPSVALTRRFLAESEHHGSQRLAVRLFGRDRNTGIPGLPASNDWTVWDAVQMRAAVD